MLRLLHAGCVLLYGGGKLLHAGRGLLHAARLLVDLIADFAAVRRQRIGSKVNIACCLADLLHHVLQAITDAVDSVDQLAHFILTR